MEIKYKYLWAWDRIMHAGEHWMISNQMRATKEKAPADAIYRDVNGKWHRFTEISSQNTAYRVLRIVEDMDKKICTRRNNR